ncbi:MAG TPA: NADP-dependent phosphogluconate dehydrogenase [Candidatus Latescibacteria bacterium]|nr:NADP-dependent phosphogluconate dehydrogenase [Candidatus Latescibacterota bacterium]
MEKCQVGLIGLAVMGQNLALNMESKGISVAVYNRTPSRTERFVEGRAGGKHIEPAYSPEELVDILERPRRIILMVKAGWAVDQVLNQLMPLLEPGDVVVDGGNSFFQDTERRIKELEGKGISFLGTGISGGEEGALKGPSIMPGGSRRAYELMEPIFEAIAAKAKDGAPCVAYLGPGGAGHYVKMVHNGIEYGDMQLIAEAYDLLRRGLGMEAEEIGRVFSEWSRGELSSFLMEITVEIFRRRDDETGLPLIDLILDRAGQKGTGRWTSQNALDLGVPTPTINAAVEARITSAYKEERVRASELLGGPDSRYRGDADALVRNIREALYASKVCTYAQGMSLLRAASGKYGYDLDLATVARIWRAGCIIRADFLDDVSRAFSRDPDLPNLLLDPHFRKEVRARQEGWRRTVCTAAKLGVPVPATAASLAYYDSYRSERLPANLIQAQRDYFGAHTYERVDREGTFHTEWREL